ncbi:MAG: hypothetical protein JXA21_02200 [Anaerolineae bacterium]|nr:hypothetical protein [Anaerolineae bacterium]
MNEDMKIVFEKLEKVTQEVNVNAVFGKPEKIGDYTIIPVASVIYGLGAGAGMGPAPATVPQDSASSSSEPAPEGEGAAGGGGGGAGAKAHPIAYIEIGPEGTRVKAIINEQKVALAGIFLSIWTIGWLGLVLKAIFGRRR